MHFCRMVGRHSQQLGRPVRCRRNPLLFSLRSLRYSRFTLKLLFEEIFDYVLLARIAESEA